MAGPVDVLLVGFGAVGAMYAFILQRGGLARVSVVARSNYHVVKEHGIAISSRKYGDTKSWRPYRVFNSVAAALDRPYAFVVIATKALPDVGQKNSEVLAPLLSPSYAFPQPAYVIMQNGLGVENDLFHAADVASSGNPRVILASLYIMANLVDGGVQHEDVDRLIIGVCRKSSARENSADETALLEDFAALIRAGGSDAQVTHEIQGIKFSKNVWNAVFSSCATLARCGLSAFFQQPELEDQVTPIIRAMFHEVVAVGRALGYDETVIPTSAIDASIAETVFLNKRPGSRHKPSMLLDLELHQPLELDVILGDLIRRARILSVDIPRIETLYALLSVVQTQLISKPAQTAVTPKASHCPNCSLGIPDQCVLT
ncbi:6-phosphogluconate dehydrogenase C-terminal domain-like protein [Exidia glandulosa HHB12029]|uniref:6-phosphogluconate dehydrogenase C-terminal domain-like protein n=1 Tax=Exidia glandulosa HHB12029 TaxID=1314781 RepID=A0A165IF60_EXIGL|nr:6-phosphogluconate dehydrogenase C-terminal domain-like protein [Exidia glandulosa HHB12029]